MCRSILIEDEFHVLMKCPLYDDLRYPLFLEAIFLYNDFDQMTEQDIFLATHVCLFYAPKPVLIHVMYIFVYFYVICFLFYFSPFSLT